MEKSRYLKKQKEKQKESIHLSMNNILDNEMSIAISSSGNSKNVIRSCEECRKKMAKSLPYLQ